MKRLLLLVLGIVTASIAQAASPRAPKAPKTPTFGVPAYSAPTFKSATPKYTYPGIQNYSAAPVRAYVKPSIGTYVAPHFRSTPDASFNNNWSTKPNVNPFTGAVGTRLPKTP